MPWTCPACRLVIQHTEDIPRPNVVYRCHVCRLELVNDPLTRKMTLAPLPTGQASRVNSKKQKPTR